ncbi:hypothetical protein [Streptomyces sp. CO7]
MNNSPWARPAALTLACALSLSLLTGCADGSDTKPSGATASPSKAAAPAAEALSEKELATLVLAEGDLDGYKIQKASEKQLRTASGSKDDVRVAEVCRPLLEADGILGEPAAFVGGAAAQIPEVEPQEDGKLPDLNGLMRIDVTAIVVASYDGDGARNVMKSLADGVETCDGEFPYTLPGKDTVTTAVTPRKSVTAEGADDAVAFMMSARKKKGAALNRTYFQVVRHGSNVITYMTLNVAKSLDGTPYALDAEVVAAQSKKATERLGIL